MYIISMFDSVFACISECATHLQLTSITLLMITTILVLIHFLVMNPSEKVFLLDFACYRPQDNLMCTKEHAVDQARLAGMPQDLLDFMKKLLDKAGLGDSCYVAETLLENPPTQYMEAARQESEMVMFGAINELLAKTGIESKDIGILIMNCSVFNIVPSFSSVIVNRYKLRDNIASYNLSGMGCSAGLVAIGLAKQLLKVHKNTCALIVSTENTTNSAYPGKDRSKFITNCLFRVGGAAILLSNQPHHSKSSKYELIHTVHTHTASSDLSYKCIFQEDDQEGITGVTINKDLMIAAIHAIESNLNSLGPLILPLKEKILYLKHYLIKSLKLAKVQSYVPKFNNAVDHFLPHVGGKPVLDELQKNLGFSDAVMEASMMTLHRFGNTSSSSVWYEFAYAEAKGRIKKDHRVWQMAFGSGFKCSSVVWRAMRDIEYDEKNPWMAEIDLYPMALDSSGSLPYYFEPSKN